jgi:hypothetical protein
MLERPHFKQSAPLDQRLEEQAKRVRKEAEDIPPGVKREKLMHPCPAGRDGCAHAGMADVPRPAGSSVMPEYRAYAVGR